jgi:hypothetical protein
LHYSIANIFFLIGRRLNCSGYSAIVPLIGQGLLVQSEAGKVYLSPMLRYIFPSPADNNYQGSKIASTVFLLLAVLGTVRSCIHLLSPDGGAGSIAGMDLSTAGADGIIFAFGLWGSAQLLYAVIQLVVYFKYKTLIPFMYVLLIAETLLRMLVGHIKPVHFAHTPPGAYGNYIALPLAVVMLYLALPKKNKTA